MGNVEPAPPHDEDEVVEDLPPPQPELTPDFADDWRQLHATIQGLLLDEAALRAQCDKLMPVVGSEYLAMQTEQGSDSEEEPENQDDEVANGIRQGAADSRRILPSGLRSVTQYIINRTGCRHPVTLKRASTVFAGFAYRSDGLSPAEFRGYVASILTQVLRELEYRSSAAGVRLDNASETLSPRVGRTADSSEVESSTRGLPGTCTPPLPHAAAAPMPPMDLPAVSAQVPLAPIGSDLAPLDLRSEGIASVPSDMPDARSSGTAPEGLSELQALTRDLEALSTSLGQSRLHPSADMVMPVAEEGSILSAVGPLSDMERLAEPTTTGADTGNANSLSEELSSMLSSLSNTPVLQRGLADEDIGAAPYPATAPS
mmetsp:Transcript_20201/g.36615  ORF Transcript_20201/g.36615 Transcript_20201/m.36615 type:complete len:373 (+) Transcript_20201:82-1200(+)